MSTRSQNLCPPEFNFLRGVICFYQLVTILWPPIMRAVTERVFDSDHLVTTGIVAHIYHLPGKRKRLQGSQTSHSSSRYKAAVISESHADQSGTNLIQLLVIRPLECIRVWFMVAEMKERPSGVGKIFESRQQDNSPERCLYTHFHIRSCLNLNIKSINW